MLEEQPGTERRWEKAAVGCGDGSVSKVLTTQTHGPEFRLPVLTEKPEASQYIPVTPLLGRQRQASQSGLSEGPRQPEK